MLKSATTFLWIAGVALQLLLMTVLFARRLWSRFPVFFTYSVFSLCVTAGMYLIRREAVVYFYAYWICEALGLVLGFGVIYELFKQLLKPYQALHRVAAIFLLSSLVIFAASSCLVAYLQSSAERGALMSAVLVAEEATRILEVGLLVFLFAFSTAFGLHWRQQTFGISLGLAVFVACELIGVTTRTHIGSVAAYIFTLIRMLSFNLSLLVWIGYLVVPERVTINSGLPERSQLEHWNRAVMELIHQ